MRLKRTYSAREVTALTGLSARQLQMWDEGGLLSAAIPSRPTAAGGYTERRYTPIELFELFVLGDLRHRGFSVPQLYAIVNTLEEQFHTTLFEATGGGTRIRLLTDGEHVYARTDRGEFYNVLDAPTQPLLVIGNEELLKELSSLRRRKRTRKTSGSGISSRGRRRGAE
jgi:DNA-binding transcriptional MerR regulator